ncbi:MAG: hypothetical protein Q7R72_01500 [bacterium]|nr:hypothetical protein [bacterium]
MKHPKFKLGDEISGIIVSLSAVVGNTDDVEGRGVPIDKSYHLSRGDAVVGASSAGPSGSNGEIQPRLALKISKDSYILLPEKAFGISLLPEETEKLRRSGLSKLSAAEKQVLFPEDKD